MGFLPRVRPRSGVPDIRSIAAFLVSILFAATMLAGLGSVRLLAAARPAPAPQASLGPVGPSGYTFSPTKMRTALLPAARAWLTAQTENLCSRPLPMGRLATTASSATLIWGL